MAFGKNPAELNKVGSFRQTSHTWNQSRTEQKKRGAGGGGKTPSWVNEYRPPTDDVDLIRVVPGAYTVEDVDAKGNVVQIPGLTFWPFVEHYDSRSKKRCICSAGANANDRNRRQPCHGCDLFWSSMKTDASGKKVKGFMGKRDMVAFTIVDYSNYHKVEQLDAQGRVKINENTQQPYFNWTKCRKSSEGRGICDACDAQKETRQGHRLHWPMGSDHYNTLLSYDETAGKACVTCGGQDTIRNEAWLCQNPDCGEAIIDEHSRLTKKEIDELVNHPLTCKQCGTEGFLAELISCVNCTPAGKEPKRATIFDVDLKIHRVEPADGSNRTSLSITGFVGPRPVPKQFAELAKPEELNKIYSPTTLELQASLFGVALRDPVTASRPYGAGSGGGPNYG